LTQYRPINIRTKVFTANLPASCALNVWASLCWHAARSPIHNHLGRDVYCDSELVNPAERFDGMFNVHAINLHTAFSCVNKVFVQNAFMETPLQRVENWLADQDLKWA
jgi:hypothetical protein